MIFRLFKRRESQEEQKNNHQKATTPTSQGFSRWFSRLWHHQALDEETLKELKRLLIRADVGVSTTDKILSELKRHVDSSDSAEDIQKALQQVLCQLLNLPSLALSAEKKAVIILLGVNGTGKTTTAAKLAKIYQQQQLSPLLAAGDTFRAAAIEQITTWSQRLNIPVVSQKKGADSAAVLYDAAQTLKNNPYDILLADTAGRQPNKTNLMAELNKVTQVVRKQLPDSDIRHWMVIDATVGQHGLQQAKLFQESVGVDGIILTKLDGSAKGGIVFAIADQLQVPIVYLGSGEGIDDITPFSAELFVESLITGSQAS